METVLLGLFMMLCFGVDRLSSEILQRQKRNWIIDSFNIDEGYQGPFPYSLGRVKAENNVTFFHISGHGVDENPKGILQINQDTGEIFVHGPVDYEEFKVLKLRFTALNRHSYKIETNLGIEIKVVDSNDNAPKFNPEKYETTIKELTSQGTDVITLMVTDKDSTMENCKSDFRIVSVTPEPHDLEFYLKSYFDSRINYNVSHSIISFKGCLDHEKAEKYTIIVEAKDHGKPIQLSSSCTVIINIEDGNNHLPVITQQTGPGRVKEGETNVLISRLQVTDEDAKGTAAWRAKYQIHGDTNNNFRITTDPETNEGLLYVEKQLNYEDGPLKNVTISVENEIPYYSCKVESRSSTSLWKVISGSATIAGATIDGVTGRERERGRSTHHVTVIVEDVNEPPSFNETNKKIKLPENLKAGQNLVTFTATDPDITSKNTFVYKIGSDPAGWVTVDPSTGKITTTKTIDRESKFVKDSIYTVTIYAVDNGKPPATSTATLDIHIDDVNDNAPYLTVSTIDICQSNGPSRANITANDSDGEPYGGPFNFKLHGDVEGKWKVDPLQGNSVNLVKEDTVHSGHYELLLEVSDLQGETAIHNLTVTVCNCLDAARPSCRVRQFTVSPAGGGVLGIILLGILLLAGMLLLASLVSCKKEHLRIPGDDSEQHLMKCNTEERGTDCKVAFDPLTHGYGHKGEQIKTISQQTMKPSPTVTVSIAHDNSRYGMSQNELLQSRNYLQRLVTDSINEESWSQAQKKNMEQTCLYRNSARWNWMGHSLYSDQNNCVIQREFLLQVLNKTLYTLQAPGEELGDYAPHVYAEEGDTKFNYELDAISIPDLSFDLDFSKDLTFKFNTLALICMPSKSSKKETHVIPTLIQKETHKTKVTTPLHLENMSNYISDVINPKF